MRWIAVALIGVAATTATMLMLTPTAEAAEATLRLTVSPLTITAGRTGQLSITVANTDRVAGRPYLYVQPPVAGQVKLVTAAGAVCNGTSAVICSLPPVQAGGSYTVKLAYQAASDARRMSGTGTVFATTGYAATLVSGTFTVTVNQATLAAGPQTPSTKQRQTTPGTSGENRPTGQPQLSSSAGQRPNSALPQPASSTVNGKPVDEPAKAPTPARSTPAEAEPAPSAASASPTSTGPAPADQPAGTAMAIALANLPGPGGQAPSDGARTLLAFVTAIALIAASLLAVVGRSRMLPPRGQHHHRRLQSPA